MIEERRIWVVLAVAALVMFFAGFKYADYRQSRLEEEKLAMEELLDSGQQESTGENKGEGEEPKVIYVHVTGAVENPGIFQLEEGARVFEVLEKARPTAEADTNQLNLAQILADQDKLIVPRIGEKLEQAAPAVSGGFITGGGSPTGGKVNINTAPVSELDARLPGIGPALAQRIVDYREQNGGFKSPEEITEVAGIGEKRYEQIKELITVR